MYRNGYVLCYCVPRYGMNVEFFHRVLLILNEELEHRRARREKRWTCVTRYDQYDRLKNRAWLRKRLQNQPRKDNKPDERTIDSQELPRWIYSQGIDRFIRRTFQKRLYVLNNTPTWDVRTTSLWISGEIM